MKTYGLRTIVIGTLMAVIFSGCATTEGVDTASGTTSSDAQIEAFFARVSAALGAQDVDAIMVNVSKDFEDINGNRKDAVRSFFEDLRDSGALEGGHLDVSEAETKIEGNMAFIQPVYLRSDLGEFTQDYALTKEADGVWRVTDVMQF
jgi:ketosteroid isomerase-like protein